MAEVLATELLVSTRGTVEAARDLNRVAEAGRSMSRMGSAWASERSADRMAEGLSKVAVRMGPIGDMMFMIENAWTRGGRNMEAFKSAIPDAALFAGTVAGIQLVINKAQELSSEADQMWVALGGQKRGMLGNWWLGAKDLLGLGGPEVSQTAPNAQELQTARTGMAEQWARTLVAGFRTPTVEQEFSRWVADRAAKGNLPTREEGKAQYDAMMAAREAAQQQKQEAQNTLRDIAGGLLRDIGKPRMAGLATTDSAEGWRAIQEWKQRDSKSDETAQNQLEELMKHTSTLQDINNALSQLQSFSMS